MHVTDSTQTHSAFEFAAAESSKTCSFLNFAHAYLDCHIHNYIIFLLG